MDNKHNQLNQPPNFSLVLGGPLYRFYLRTHLAKPPLDLYPRRIIIITLFVWLPLLLLVVIGGVAFSGVKVPFIFDIETQTRFLGSLVLLIAAELIVHQRIQLMVSQFSNDEIIAPENRVQFNNIIASAIRLRSSIIVEVILIILVFTVGRWTWKEYTALSVATWYAVPTDGHMHFTLAGYWYTFVSLPIFQFLLLRWYFCLFVWYRFLWQVSRLPLRLNSLHPDKAGGLGFLADSIPAFLPLLLAHTVLLGGAIANRIWHAGASLPEFRLEIVSIIFFLVFLVLTPLCFFLLPLAKAKQIGTYKYNKVANSYVNDFRRKWLDRNVKSDEVLLGTADIQSLSDLSSSFEVTNKMRLVPFNHITPIQLAVLIALPFVPLILTMIPLKEVIDSIIKMIL